MTGNSIAALVSTMLVLAIVPGPSDLAVVARSIASGFAQALIMVGGIVAADILFIVFAIYSLAEVAESLGVWFLVVKYACGAYLIWLGIGALKARSASADLTVIQTSETKKSSGFSSFLGGLLITLGDPKAILFYMGLFPAFVDLAQVSIRDTLVIMLVATGVVGGVKAGYAYLADRAKHLFANPSLCKKLDALAGIVLICTGLFLIVKGIQE